MAFFKSFRAKATKFTSVLGTGWLAGFFLLSCPGARAEIIHLIYSGDSFTYPYREDRFGHKTYTGGGSIFGSGPITGELVLDLPDTFSYDVGSFVTSYSFTAGAVTITSGTPRTAGSIHIGIDSGKVFDWEIQVSNQYYSIGTKYWFDGTRDYATSSDITVENRNDRGVWTVSSVPEPASWGMMLLGLAGVGCACRRLDKTNSVDRRPSPGALE